MIYTSVTRSLVVILTISLGVNTCAIAASQPNKTNLTLELTKFLEQEKLINLVGQLKKFVENKAELEKNKAELTKHKAEIKGLIAQDLIDSKKQLSFKEFLQRIKYHLTSEKACELYADMLPFFGAMTASIVFVLSAEIIFKHRVFSTIISH